VINFPAADIGRMGRDESFYRAAAVCRRGHAAKNGIMPGEGYPVDTKCTKCGATVLTACTSCGLRIQGRHFVPGVIGATWSRPSFCDGCGAAHPWATREERIFELENILDEEDIDEADRLFIQERLRDLRESELLDEKREKQLWTQIRDRSVKFVTSPPVQKITETLITAAVRKQLEI
jgi:hypothetical protein